MSCLIQVKPWWGTCFEKDITHMGHKNTGPWGRSGTCEPGYIYAVKLKHDSQNLHKVELFLLVKSEEEVTFWNWTTTLQYKTSLGENKSHKNKDITWDREDLLSVYGPWENCMEWWYFQKDMIIAPEFLEVITKRNMKLNKDFPEKNNSN